MGLNIGYLTAKTNKDSDEVFTPKYAVEPIMKYIDKNQVIWCPFDQANSEFVRIFKRNGYKVIYSHIDDGKNFFTYEPEEHYDVIVSNPPFSQKDFILKRLDELEKPYAILLPIAALQGKARYKYLKDGLQLLVFDKRINYYINQNMNEVQKGAPFASAYFCKGVLPKDLILEELKIY